MFTAIVAMAAATSSLPSSQAGATVRAMFGAFNAHDPAAMAKLYAPDASLTSSDFCAARRGTDVVRTYADLFRDMPDIHDEVDSLIVEGSRVAVRFTASSRKAGFTVRIMTFLTVRDGRIVEDDSVFDTGGRPCSA